MIIFDADFGLANVEVMFGAAPRYNLSDVLYYGKRIADVITEGPTGIGFISAGSGIVGLKAIFHRIRCKRWCAPLRSLTGWQILF